MTYYKKDGLTENLDIDEDLDRLPGEDASARP